MSIGSERMALISLSLSLSAAETAEFELEEAGEDELAAWSDAAEEISAAEEGDDTRRRPPMSPQTPPPPPPLTLTPPLTTTFTTRDYGRDPDIMLLFIGGPSGLS